MRKHLTCRALGMNCTFEVHDESEDEITVVIGDHLKRAHGLDFTNALRQKARDLIILDTASHRQ
jgi:predicted small metal-binding protein